MNVQKLTSGFCCFLAINSLKESPATALTCLTFRRTRRFTEASWLIIQLGKPIYLRLGYHYHCFFDACFKIKKKFHGKSTFTYIYT